MQLLNAPNDKGFTLIELIIIVFIVGILGAISTPSFLALADRSRVNTAIANVKGALQEAQREAMRKSKYCNVTLTSVSSPTITSSTSCLVTGTRKLDNVSMQTSIDNTTLSTSLKQFQFNFQGITYNTNTPPAELSNDLTIVISPSGNPNFKKCLVLSSPLGLIRTGTYRGTNAAIADNCSIN